MPIRGLKNLFGDPKNPEIVLINEMINFLMDLDEGMKTGTYYELLFDNEDETYSIIRGMINTLKDLRDKNGEGSYKVVFKDGAVAQLNNVYSINKTDETNQNIVILQNVQPTS